MGTIVLKFGGSSVADNEKLRLVANKVTTLVDEGYDVVVVVSAQGKKTDSLLNEAYELSQNPDSRELDVLLSTGEQVSISKLSILLNDLGYKATSLTGWQAGIYTSSNNQNAIIKYIDTARIKKELDNNNVVIVAGFQGINEKMDITTLGRGGSDTTAISIAAALNANGCYIYSDVEGVFTADPRIVSSAKKLNNISYEAMVDVANEGAKVLHNRCVEIAKKFNIPIIAKSTFNEDNGTIVNNYIEDQKIKSLVKSDNLVEACIPKSNINYLELCKCLLSNKIIPLEISNKLDTIYVLFKLDDFYRFKNVWHKNLDLNSKQISKISIVGHEIVNNESITKKIYEGLQQEAENITRIELCNTKIRITFSKVIENDYFKGLHDNLINDNSRGKIALRLFVINLKPTHILYRGVMEKLWD